MKSIQQVTIPLVAILRGILPDEVLEHARALIAEGFEMIEVPANSPQWQESVTLLQNELGDQAIIGAGTIVQHSQYAEFLETKAKLLVTPNLNRDIVKTAVADGMITCIGALSPTEIFEALDLGVDVVKVFPAGSMGLSYCKAILSVVPKERRYYAVGGVNPDNLHEYLALGFCGAGLGSDLYRPSQSAQTTRLQAAKFVNAYRAALA